MAKNIYGASSIELSSEAMEDLKRLEGINSHITNLTLKNAYDNLVSLNIVNENGEWYFNKSNNSRCKN